LNSHLVRAKFELITRQAVAQAERHGLQVCTVELADQPLELQTHATGKFHHSVAEDAVDAELFLDDVSELRVQHSQSVLAAVLLQKLLQTFRERREEEPSVSSLAKPPSATILSGQKKLSEINQHLTVATNQTTLAVEYPPPGPNTDKF
jgi:hypothetical protein